MNSAILEALETSSRRQHLMIAVASTSQGKSSNRRSKPPIEMQHPQSLKSPIAAQNRQTDSQSSRSVEAAASTNQGYGLRFEP